ncbi:MAG: WG repeat-containing protein [Rikenellaceae bacterium]
MSATINNFISALSAASESLSTLRDAVIAEVEVSRTTHFAEVEIEWHGRVYLLSMPLNNAALSMAKHAAVKLRSRRSKILLERRILLSEMTYVDSCGRVQQCDLVLEEIPRGRALSEVASTIAIESLASSIAQLECEFGRLVMRHGNLKCENIIVGDDSLLYPVRLHSVALDEDCHAEFETLRSEICAVVGCEPSHLACDDGCYTEAAEPLNALYGYSSVGNPFEGMCVAESSTGYGYITPEGDEIISPRYLWASNMREGRAEVETSDGMGLIDSAGAYIIEPRYEIVEFDSNTGLSRAKRDGRWFTFDYQGRAIE